VSYKISSYTDKRDNNEIAEFMKVLKRRWSQSMMRIVLSLRH